MTMQKIKDLEWKKLQDAYGNAAAVPSLLEKVISDKSRKSDAQSGPWFDLGLGFTIKDQFTPLRMRQSSFSQRP
jgi:hypothetical protein